MLQPQCIIDGDVDYVRSLALEPSAQDLIVGTMRIANEYYENTMCLIFKVNELDRIDPAGGILDAVRGDWRLFMIYGIRTDGSAMRIEPTRP